MAETRKPVKPDLFQKFLYFTVRAAMILPMRLKYGYHVKAHQLKEPSIVMSNHLTDDDLMLVGIAFKDFFYVLCSEHLMRANGFLKWAITRMKFIPLFKGSVAASSTYEILKRVRDGNNVLIFPEGSRTFDGRTNAFPDSTGKLIRTAKCGLVTYHMKGGYFAHPRWAKTMRKGPISGSIVREYSSEELAAMTPAQINEILRRDLWEDAYATQEKQPKQYRGKRLAEGLENILYLCPHCGKLDSLQTRGDRFCCDCGLDGTYDAYGMLNGNHVPFRTVAQWYDWENEEFQKIYDREEILYCIPDTRLIEITTDHQEHFMTKDELFVDKEGLRIGSYCYPFAEMEGNEYINLGNTFLFCSHGKYYSVDAPHLGSVKFRKLYLKKKNGKM